MISRILDNSTIPYLAETVNFAQARHTVLAGNIANLDTPGYKTRDLSESEFQQRLADAIQARQETHESLTSPLSPGGPSDPLRKVHDSLNSIMRHDEVNVGMEQQVLEVSKNSALHSLAVTIMSNQFQLLQAMISERV